MDWSVHAVSQSQHLHPYVPGKPVRQLLAEKGLSEGIKLASNENPYGPSPKAITAVRRAAGSINRYPDGDASELRQALADRHHVMPANILAGNGSNEVLELVIRTFAGSGDEVVYSGHGFIVYALAATAAGATGVAVPEADGLSHDLEAMAAAVSSKTKLVCIANPNNPTGSLHSQTALQHFLDILPRRIIVILDEAYYEYVADEADDSIGVLKHPGLIICRTFSKAYGLAGLRIGYAVGDAEILALVNRFREPFNVGQLAQQAAVAALEDTAWVMERVAECKTERRRLETALEEWGVLGGKSFGNFVLLRHQQAAFVLQRLEDQGIIPRPLAPYGMPDFLRITVGTVEENIRLLAALSSILASCGLA